MLTGYQLAYNSRENIECYKAGLDSASGLEVTPVPCAPNGHSASVEWGIPCSNNGVSHTGFNWQKATNATKPRADAIKTLTILNVSSGGSYGRWLVPDSYTISDWVAACCAGCDPLPATTIVQPVIFSGAKYTIPAGASTSGYQAVINVPAFTGTNNTYTATGYANDANGNAITFAPATSTGTTVAALAANMQTNWGSELGGGTFTATGNTITYKGTTGASVGFTIAQSTV